jgi:hypothetical protein
MKTVSHLWQYLTEFFLEWEIFQIKSIEKIKTHFMFSNFVSKIVPFLRECGKIWWSQRSQKIWLMRVAWWISKATRAQAHASARAPTHTPPHPPTLPPHKYTHTHTHTQRNI